MAAFQKFNIFATDLAKGNHHMDAAGDVLKVAMTNGAPLATNVIKGDLTDITAQNGYPAGGSDIQNDVTQSTNVANVTAVDVVWTATGGAFGPWRYAYIYNDTTAAPVKPLVGFFDYGTSQSTNTGETLTIDFGATIYTITC